MKINLEPLKEINKRQVISFDHTERHNTHIKAIVEENKERKASKRYTAIEVGR